MRVLLVFCHPRADSFAAALRDAARAALEGAGHEVVLRDLYALGFEPCLSAAEQAGHLAGKRDGLDEEIAALRAAEALLLVYPTWWFGMPAMLKGWFDRVWAPDVAFRLGPHGPERLLENIGRIGVVTTYGSPFWALLAVGFPDRRLVSRGLRPLCARGCRMQWWSLTAMDQRGDADRAAFLTRVRAALARW